MTASDAAALLDATRLFVRRHDEALGSAQPARILEAVEGLHKGLAGTLAAEAARVHDGVLSLGRTPPRTPGQLAQSLERFASGDAFEREAWAYTALAKRVAESEGALLHLRLTLSKGSADGPVASAWARRVAGETTTVSRTLAALLVVLEAWADAARAAFAASEGRAAPPPARPPRSPRDALRAARECLLSGVPEGAAAPLAAALRIGLAAPVLGVAAPDALEDVLAAWRARGVAPPIAEDDLRAAERALADGIDDPVLAWRLLDFVEMAVQRAGMTPLPTTGPA